MRLSEYRREQDEVTRDIVALVVDAIRATIPLGVIPTDVDIVRLARLLLPSVLQARRRSFLLALQVYREERSRHTGEQPESAPAVAESHYDEQALISALDRTLRPRSVDGEGVTDDNVAAAGMAVARHVEMAGREAMIRSVELDRRALAWARVLTGRDNCAFCAMLASRGAVYTSERAALYRRDGRRYHDGCDCLVVPIFDRRDWPGREQAEDLYRFWLRSTRGKSGKDAINAFRRALAEERPSRFAATRAA